MSTTDKQIEIPPPPLQEWFLSRGLYDPMPLNVNGGRYAYDLIMCGLTIDCYCSACKGQSVFSCRAEDRSPRFEGPPPIQPTTMANIVSQQRQLSFSKEFVCTRNADHPSLVFHFQVSGGQLEKVGQWPSVATLYEGQLSQYRRILDEEKYKEFARGVGLAAHGVGIGAFVYLRRIFESLIDDAEAKAKSHPGWDAELFRKGRMDEKIQMLRNYLPSFLVQNRSLYSIMSLGIHDLSEADCRAKFNVVRGAIELILEEKLAEKARVERTKAVQADIDALNRSLNNPQNPP